MSIKKGTFIYSNKNIKLSTFIARYIGLDVITCTNIYNTSKNDYEFLYSIYKKINTTNTIYVHDDNYLHKKADRQLNEIINFLKDTPIDKIDKIDKNDKINIVDIGCGNGLLLQKIINHYNFNYNCVCIETQLYLDKSVIDLIDFRITDGKKINLENNFANITICYLSLHHFRTIDNMMDEIVRIIKPNAYLLIYEHDCKTNYNTFLLDLYHIINELLLKPNITNYMDYYKKFVNNYYSNYTSKKKLIKRLSTNFNLIKSKNIDAGFINNYYALFQKKI
jgi:ubiquinone/menaquinone biosynthesis C-methylase UbiE